MSYYNYILRDSFYDRDISYIYDKYLRPVKKDESQVRSTQFLYERCIKQQETENCRLKQELEQKTIELEKLKMILTKIQSPEEPKEPEDSEEPEEESEEVIIVKKVHNT